MTPIASRLRSTEAIVFSAAAVLGLAHAFDDALLAPGAGVPLTTHALALAIALVSTVAAVVWFESMRPGARAATAFTFGFLATVNGGRHAHHVIYEGATANDVTGLLALAGGIALIGLAAWIPFRHRGERTANAKKRSAIRVAVLPAGLLAALLFYLPVGMAVIEIHSLHKDAGSPPGADYQTVQLTTSDGLKLKALYRPSRNGAAVLKRRSTTSPRARTSSPGGSARSACRPAPTWRSTSPLVAMTCTPWSPTAPRRSATRT